MKFRYAKPVAAVMGDPPSLAEVFGPERLETLAQLARVLPYPVTRERWQESAADLANVEVIFGTWYIPSFKSDDLLRLPKLRAVFYAAGSVRYFAPPLLDRDIEIYSAASANAIPVAEFTLGQILLANKGYFRNTREYKQKANYETGFRGRGNFGVTIALLGAGEIGRMVIDLLKPFHIHVIVFDPFLTETDAARLGVEKVGLQEAFARGFVVSNHLADVPETRCLINGPLFEILPPNATFINTGRGNTVCEAGMIRVLKQRTDLSALLDVSNPEPPDADSMLYTLHNVQLSSHIAGSIGDERGRMADWMIEEYQAWREGSPTRLRVTPERFARMA